MRIQPNHLSFSSSSAHKEIYGFKSPFVKGEFYTQILSEYGKSSIVSAVYDSSLPSDLICQFSSDLDHGRLKRILGTGFTNTALAAVEQNIKEHTMRLCRRLAFEGRRRKPVNLAKWFACFSLDVGPCCIAANY